MTTSPDLIEAVARAMWDRRHPWAKGKMPSDDLTYPAMARNVLSVIEEAGFVIVPVRAGANVIAGHSPLDLSNIDPVGSGAVYIDGLNLYEAGALLAARPRVT